VIQTCTAINRCFASGASGGCHLCDEGEYRCSGSVLQLCNASTRQAFDDVMDCTDMALCDAPNGMCLPDGSGGAPG
jgi:hypothetical protein